MIKVIEVAGIIGAGLWAGTCILFAFAACALSSKLSRLEEAERERMEAEE